ncbi:MAG: KpsF/GutQ family sugar-phosphate isomerase [Kiritimatiellae bacterium]|nr:KpsF/GutQ family sugar-phosphate isomerase [Kiritimatiellia bacterium]
MDGLQKVRDGLGEEFGRAVGLFLDSLHQGGKIIITGLGKSMHIGLKIAATFTSTGTPSCLLHPSDAMHGDLGVIADEDVLLALSYSGASDELLNLLPIVKRRQVQIVSMTGDIKSPLAQHSDEVIPVTIDKEACPFNMAPTTSTTAMLAIGDALAMVLLEARGFDKEDYAKLHPGGAIGSALLLRVEDIMRTTDRLAVVSRGAKVKDAVLAMTSSKAGSAAVVDESQRILGIFTDGDLRRLITDKANINRQLEQCVEEVMTPDPITITQDHLAVDVLQLFEHHNIEDILIVNEKNQLAGFVDIQDLPKLKVF